jgi:3-oxoacyl-[acyl-carrier protein] reductase
LAVQVPKRLRAKAFTFLRIPMGEPAAAECISAMRRAGGDGEPIQADTFSESDVRAMIKVIAAWVGRLDVLIGAPVQRRLEWLILTTWGETPAFLCDVRAAMLLLKRSSASRAIFVGSAAARLGCNIGSHYAASKAALTGLFECLSRAVGSSHITVNLVESAARTELPIHRIVCALPFA